MTSFSRATATTLEAGWAASSAGLAGPAVALALLSRRGEALRLRLRLGLRLPLRLRLRLRLRFRAMSCVCGVQPAASKSTRLFYRWQVVAGELLRRRRTPLRREKSWALVLRRLRRRPLRGPLGSRSLLVVAVLCFLSSSSSSLSSSPCVRRASAVVVRCVVVRCFSLAGRLWWCSPLCSNGAPHVSMEKMARRKKRARRR